MKIITKKIALGAALLAVLCVTILLICNQQVVSNGKEKAFSDIDSIEYNEVGVQNEEETGRFGGLNAIRFNNFKDKDWFDNEYIRCLRMYLDDYNSGKIKDEKLDLYKEKVRGKFVIGAVEPYLLGGLFIRIVFVDEPDNIFDAWVYSSVDEDTETVMDYSVRGISYEGGSEFTKDDIHQFLKENPWQKVW